MNDRSRDRGVAARHVAFSLAVRDRDTLEAARAASRLRIPGVRLTTREFTAARRARTSIGRALVRARLPQPESTEVAPPPVTPRRLRRAGLPIWRALALAGVVALAFLLIRPGGGFFGGGGTEPAKPAGVMIPANATLRGRTVGLASQVVASSPRPTTTPAVGVPGTSATPVPIGGAGGGSPVPGGGGGVGGPSAAPTATPQPIGLGFSLLTVVVTDGQTGQPLASVCVVIGAGCDAGHLTDARGIWQQKLPLIAGNAPFDMQFQRGGYLTQSQTVKLVENQEVKVPITLVRG